MKAEDELTRNNVHIFPASSNVDSFEEIIENQELLALAKERSEEIHSGESGVHTWEAIKAKHGL